MLNKIKKILYTIYLSLFHGGVGNSMWKRKFASFGSDSTICYPAILQGVKDIYIGNRTTIHAYSRMQNYYEGGNNPSIHIGNHCYIGYYFSILNASNVTLGNDVLIASHVLISSENHGVNPESEIPYMNQPLISKAVTICDGCWIGENVCILPGVTIGRKCIIGAGSIVTKSIPDYCTAVGNPARVIKKYNFDTHSWDTI